MTSDNLDSLTELMTKPPNELLAGSVLFSLVYGSFFFVEALLYDRTKFEIALWLVGISAERTVPWPDTVAKMFDKVFGKLHLSWKCFSRSCFGSLVTVAAVLLFLYAKSGGHLWNRSIRNLSFSYENSTGLVRKTLMNPAEALALAIAIAVTLNLTTDYCSLLKTRRVLSWMANTPSALATGGLLVGDFVFSYVCGGACLQVGRLSTRMIYLGTAPAYMRDDVIDLIFDQSVFYGIFFYTAFMTSGWIWFYVGSGFLLKAARRFDVRFQWFTRKFDIERRPLSNIGFIAGALAVVLYWSHALISRTGTPPRLFFDWIANLVTNPPLHLVIGGVLFGITFAFFALAENLAKADVEHDVSRWLLNTGVFN
jgi:hypothetical protein